MTVERIELPSPAPGTRRHLLVHRFGRPGARPKAYLQAGIHADELPGVAILVHLLERLEALEAAGAVRGEVVVVPVANPVGLAQSVMGQTLGRYDLGQMSNFNRGWPELGGALAERVGGRLGDDAGTNGELVRETLVELARELPADSENAALRKELFCAAAGADIILDLHCDSQAVTHLYLGTPLWPDAEDLGPRHRLGGDAPGRAVGRRPVRRGLLAPLVGAAPSLPGPAAAGGLPRRHARVSRLPGRRWRTCGRGCGGPPPLPDPARRAGGRPRAAAAAGAPATPLAGVAMVRAPVTGVIDYAVEPGQHVAEGELLATLIDPLAGAGPAERHEVRSPVAGVLFARKAFRLARPGTTLGKIAGREALPGAEGWVAERLSGRLRPGERAWMMPSTQTGSHTAMPAIPERMRVLEASAFRLDALRLVERPVPRPGRGEILVRVRAASLNYRDLVILKGVYRPDLPLPYVPVSDGCGEVAEVGEGVTRFRVGDRVVPTYTQGWIDGLPTPEMRRERTLGGPLAGRAAGVRRRPG